jgi:hypothetical protein
VVGAAGTGGLVGALTTGSVSDSYTMGTVDGDAGTGGLVGNITTGVMTSTYATGDVTGTASTGGLVGSTTGLISFSSASGNVTGAAGTGGLAGVTTGHMTQNYATGNVTGGAGTGGLAGTTTGNIDNSYATGNVTATTGGGLVGTTTGTIIKSHAAGTATLGSVIAGIAGTGTVDDNTTFWDNSKNPRTAAAGSGTGITSVEMATPGTIFTDAGWDTSIWDFSGSWPILKALIRSVTVDVKANDVGKVYDSLVYAGPYTATFSDATATYTGTLSYGGDGVTATNVGSYAVTPFGLTSTSAQYVFDYVDGNLTITPKALAITGMAATNKTYDGGTVAALTGGLLDTGIAGEALTFTGQTGTFADKNAANGIAVTVTGTTLEDNTGLASNYALTPPTVAAANITPKALTLLGITADNKVYDGNTSAVIHTGTVTFDGVMASDTVTADASAIAATFVDKNVGNTKSLNLSGIVLSGADGNNYTVAGAGGVSANITPKPVMITGMAATNKAYDGGTVAALTGGLLDTGIAGEALTFTGQTGTFADKNAANGIAVTVTGTTLEDNTGLASNYALIQATGLTANITAVPVIDNQTPQTTVITQVQSLSLISANTITSNPYLTIILSNFEYQSPVSQNELASSTNNNGAGLTYVFVKQRYLNTESKGCAGNNAASDYRGGQGPTNVGAIFMIDCGIRLSKVGGNHNADLEHSYSNE